MAANSSHNETTVRRLLETLTGLWTACKNAFQTKLGIDGSSGDTSKYLNQKGAWSVPSVSAVGPYTAFTLNDGIKGYTHLFTLDFGTVKKGVCEFRVNCTRAITATVVINASIARTDDTGGTTKAWMTLTAETVAITDYFKICYKESSDSTSSRPKYDIWLIDTGSNIASARRIGVEIVNTNIASISKGGTTTETLPSDLVDFTYANVKEVAVSSRNLYNQGNSSNTKCPVFFDGSGSGFKGVYTMPNLTAYYDTGNGVIWIVGASGGEKTNARRGSVRIGNGAYVGKIWSDNLTASRDLQLPNASGTFALQDGDYRTNGLQSAYATQSGFANESTYAAKIGSSASHPQIGGPRIPVYVDQYGNVIECDSPSLWTIGYAQRSNKLYASSYGGSNVPMCLKSDGEGFGEASPSFKIPHTAALWHREINNGTITGVGIIHYTSKFVNGPSDNLVFGLKTPSTNVLQLTVDAGSTRSWNGGQVWGTIKWDSQTGSNINSFIDRIGNSNLNGTDVVLASRNLSTSNVQDIQGHALLAICTGDNLHAYVIDMVISVIKANASSTLCYISVMSKCFEEDY